MCDVMLQVKEGVIMRQLADSFLRHCDRNMLSIWKMFEGFSFENSGLISFYPSGNIQFHGDDNTVQNDFNFFGGVDHLLKYFSVRDDEDFIVGGLKPCSDPNYILWELPSLKEREKKLATLSKEENAESVIHGKVSTRSEETKRELKFLRGRIRDYEVRYEHPKSDYYSSKLLYKRQPKSIADIHAYFGAKR